MTFSFIKSKLGDFQIQPRIGIQVWNKLRDAQSGHLLQKWYSGTYSVMLFSFVVENMELSDYDCCLLFLNEVRQAV